MAAIVIDLLYFLGGMLFVGLWIEWSGWGK
jgi:hypothetical protein